MPFNHNDAYHRLLVRQVPPGARTALDVGCGTGRFARRLAATGLDVDAVDPAEYVVEFARAYPSDSRDGVGRVTYHHADIADYDLAADSYDFISCLASLHHVPFATVQRLVGALRPGGVLAVLGLGKARSPADLLTWGIVAPPVNLAARAVVGVGDWLNGGADTPPPPVRDSYPTMTTIRRESARLLPGRRIRMLLFWRYLLIFRSETGRNAS